jgi:hypothetical protein
MSRSPWVGLSRGRSLLPAALLVLPDVVLPMYQ